MFCVLASWQRYCTASSSGRQPNFAALNTGRHLCLAGRPSRWALGPHSSLSLFCRIFCPGTLALVSIKLWRKSREQTPCTKIRDRWKMFWLPLGDTSSQFFFLGGGGGANTMRPGSRPSCVPTKWHLDPSNRLATIHERYKAARHTVGQRSDSIGRISFTKYLFVRLSAHVNDTATVTRVHDDQRLHHHHLFISTN